MPTILIRFSFLLLISAFVGLKNSNAQLLQDRNKLKTEFVRKEGGGFLFFRKSVKGKSNAKSRSKVERGRTPRFSQGSRGVSRQFTPKFSKPQAGRAIVVSPRYSRQNTTESGDRGASPRYTRKRDKNKIIVIRPKFSEPRGTQKKIEVNPRFSQGSNSDNYILKPPKSASDQGMVFTFPRVLQYIKRPKNHGEDAWEGPLVKIPTKFGRRYHPSSNYLTARNNSSKLVRTGMRKFNILWTRVNGNKSSPKVVDNKSDKGKHDKHESEIWNNKEREYIKN